MNKVELIGRLVKDPQITTSQSGTRFAKYTLAVDRPKRQGENAQADFIQCTVFGNGADFVDKYLHKGMKIAVIGKIATGSYTNKNGQTVYTTEVIVEEHEFCERRQDYNSQPQQSQNNGYQQSSNQAYSQGSQPNFTEIGDGDDLPF